YKNIGELYTIFRVVVLPKEIESDDENFFATFDPVTYDGSEKKPLPANVTYKDISLTADDYTLDYRNNVNAGDQAQAIFTFIGNYIGEVTVNFTVKAAENKYSVTWQYFDGTNWRTDAEFIYDGTDQSGKIRAALTTDLDAANVQYTYVYAKDLADSALQNTTNMYLQINGTFGGENVSELLNAAEYAVTIMGSGNYSLPDDKSTDVTVSPKTITFDSLDYADANGIRLWQLDFGNTMSSLRDSVTYIVDNQAVAGNETDAYARFRNTTLTVRLNPHYTYNGQLLSYYMENANVSYAGNSAIGAQNTVTDVHTAVTFVFNANFAVYGATDNTVTLNKTWHIVTINNGLHGSDGGEATLPAFTFGEENDIQPFKPEHGNTVFFTFRQGATAISRVAVVYNGEAKVYYLFNVDDEGEYVLGDEMPGESYFADVVNDLAAGNYQLDVHVDEYIDADMV
ncbi:MAG: hypothetical protein K2L51_04610, partial [Clostridiales bacterium]|nr:hypothetical protein [Clostridiales bacterium]